MAATLQDVVNQLKNNQKVSDQTNKNVDKTTSAVGKLTASITKSFSMFFDLKKAERLNLDPLETAREARNKDKSTFTKNFEAGQKAGDKSLGSLMDMLDLAKMFGPLLAAIPLAIAGMRGWEVPVISKLTTGLINGFGKLADSFKVKFNSGVDDIMRSVLKSFGINPATGKMARDARGRFTGREMKTTAVMISEAFDLLHVNVTRAFGVGMDGGMIGRIVSRAGRLMSTIISPLISVGNAISGWASGSGAKLLGFMDSVLGISGGVANIGKFAGFVGKILKPIGFLFSAYDGVMAFMNTEGTFMDKFVAGIGAFIGDFVGAPLDLLKSIVAWSLEQLGFENAAKWLESWSFETIINDMIGGIWNMAKGAVDWIKLLFTDPGQALSDLFWGYVGVYKSIGEWLYSISIKPLWTWFENTFPDLSLAISEMWTAALGGAADLGTWIWENSIGPLWDWISTTFSWQGIKSKLGLDATGGPAIPGQDETTYGIPGNYKGGSIPYGKFGVVGERGPELITGPVNVVPLPKKTGNNLQQEQFNLTQSQNRGKAAFLMANSGNTVNNTQSSVTYATSGMPNPYDRPSRQMAGYGMR